MFYLVTFTYQFNDSLNRIYLLLLKVFFCGATSQIGLGGRVFKVSGSHTIRHTHQVGLLCLGPYDHRDRFCIYLQLLAK